MNEVFPSVYTVSTADAEPGTILKIPRSEGALLALAVEAKNGNGCTLVILNSTDPNRPPVFFVDNWRNENSCLAYKGPFHFEISVVDADTDFRGHKWWETTGVIISIKDQLYIRAVHVDAMRGSFLHVNVQTGKIFTDQIPNDVWSFGAWQLWLRDSYKRHLSIFEFNIAKLA